MLQRSRLLVVLAALLSLLVVHCGGKTALRTRDAAFANDGTQTPPDIAPPDVPSIDTGVDLFIPPFDIVTPSDVTDDTPNPRCRNSADCDDRVYCNGEEFCFRGECFQGFAIGCNDNVECTLDRCDEALRQCVSEPNASMCPTGSMCDPMRGCVRNRCRSNAECSNNSFCDGDEICDLATGMCGRGPRRCPLSSNCVVSTCVEATRTCSTMVVDTDADGALPIGCPDGTDCDDLSSAVHPGATESCNDRIDNNCNGLTDCVDSACANSTLCCVTSGPETAAACNDGRDNDCNGLTDCRDPMCARLPSCCLAAGQESTDALCNDGIDNDCNGLTDCSDARCARLLRCCTRPTPTESNRFQVGMCGDGIDNDCNGLTDCADPGCRNLPESELGGASSAQCVDGLDNDCDGLTDCQEDGCYRTHPMCCTRTGTETTAATCTDGLDNDCNRLTDCQQLTCAGTGMCPCRPELCSDSIDNDCDGLTDCNDHSDCDLDPSCCIPRGPEDSAATCNNTFDDDCDGATDCQESICRIVGMCLPSGDGGVMDAGPGCGTNAQETSVMQCTNGVDDDCDGTIDCNDTDCRPFPSTQTECCNGRDDNANGLVDEAACGCTNNMSCAGVGGTGTTPSPLCYDVFHVCGPACGVLGGDAFCNRLQSGRRCNVMTGQCF